MNYKSYISIGEQGRGSGLKKKPKGVDMFKKPKTPKFLPVGKDYIDPYVLCDQVHIRNACIRAQYDALADNDIVYNARIKYLSKRWFTSPKNVERVVNRNGDPSDK